MHSVINDFNALKIGAQNSENGDAQMFSLPEIQALHTMFQWTATEVFPRQSQDLINLFNDKFARAPVRICALDCEFIRTVGRDNSVARLSLRDYRGDQTWDELIYHHEDIICDLKTEITGLTVKDVQGGKAFSKVKRKLVEFLTDPRHCVILVGHDIKHDLFALQMKKLLNVLAIGLIDTSVLFYFEGAVSRTPGLQDLYGIVTSKKLRGPTGDGVHDSQKDCSAALEIFEHALHHVCMTQQRCGVTPTADILKKWESSHIFEVKDMNIKTTEATIRALFSKFGNIKRIRNTHEKVHQPRGGFVKVFNGAKVYFHSDAELDVEEVVSELNGKVIDGHAITVSIYMKKGETRGHPIPYQQHQQDSYIALNHHAPAQQIYQSPPSYNPYNVYQNNHVLYTVAPNNAQPTEFLPNVQCQNQPYTQQHTYSHHYLPSHHIPPNQYSNHLDPQSTLI